MDAIAAAALAALSLVAVLLARRVRALGAEVAGLGERVSALSAQLEAAEHDVAGALARTEVAETVLLEKGLADEEDLEAARRRFGDDGGARADAPRDGELH
jgi:hypothetical protein